MYARTSQGLAEFFDGIAVKRLSSVEVSRLASNQHEFNGVKALRALFGSERAQLRGHFVYLSEEDGEDLSAETGLTWYDAREAHATRTEYRLYFEDNPVLEMAAEGDLLFIGTRPGDIVVVAIAHAGSTAENYLLWLSRMHEAGQGEFRFREQSDIRGIDVSFVERQILEQLGISTVSYDSELLHLTLAEFGGSFPPTRQFSAFARGLVHDADAVGEPDATLLQWLDQEERAFRQLERHLVAERLEEGFSSDVDEFVRFSLTVHNRRKSRAGQAFENHLEQILIDNGIHYARGIRTEGKSRPDFVFPGEAEYHDASFPEARLRMLAAKTSCKERWRQILTEAQRIPAKHLITLEPGISEDQTDQMKTENVQLIVPSPLAGSYTKNQNQWLIDLRSFLDSERRQQTAHPA